jgi:hypothetical protein
MNRFSGWSFVVPAALVMLLCSSMSASAAPFQVGQTTCGTLSKVRDQTGAVNWVVTGCPELEKAILEQQTCGDGILDMNEQCDTGPTAALDPVNCTDPLKPYCQSCHCVAQIISATPTPTPTVTPSGSPGACPFGELPPGSGNFVGGRAVTKRRFGTVGESQTYCFTVTSTAPVSVLFHFAADTGTCMWDNLTITPPPNSGIVTSSSGAGLTGGVTYRSVPNPAGTWLVTITDLSGGSCPSGTYQLYESGVQ